MQVFLRCITALVLVLSLGLHWALLQTVAWTGMLISYSRSGTFSEAVSKTFDGKHPCCLCKTLKQERDAEKKADKTKAGSQVDPALIWEPPVFDFSCPRERVVFAEAAPPPRCETPPKPHPRSFSPGSLA